MKHFYTLLFALFITGLGFGQTLSSGDIAIIGLSVDNEEALIVALENIPSGESVFFTDDEWGGSSFNSGEGFYEWVTPAITAGTVFTIDTSGTSIGGTVTSRAGSFALSNSGDGFYLYQTSTNVYNTGAYTVLGFAGEDAGDAGTLAGTGLVIGTSAIYYGGDNGIYTGTRVGQDKATYLSLIYDSANWATSGSSQTFVLTDFTFAAGCTAPFQASSFTTLLPSTTDVNIEFTRGGGNDVLVVMKEGAAVNTDPTNGTSYTANSIFSGAGASELGTGNFVVFNGNNGTSNPGVGGASLNISVTGLTEDTTYHIAVFEYNTVDTCYNLVELFADFTTPCATPSDVSGFTATAGNSEIDLAWTNGSCFDEILVVAKETSAVTQAPTGDGTAYTADAALGSGTDLGGNEYAVFKGTGTSVTVTGLTNGTAYHFTVFTRKGTSWSTGVVDNATPVLNWCSVTGDTSFGTSITLVDFGDINNVTGAGSGYDDFTAQTTDVSQGSTEGLTVNIDTAGNFTIHAIAWIDWNQNGVFDIATEEYDLGTTNNNANGPTSLSTLSIAVPVGAVLGNTRMRVVCRYDEDPSGPCDGSDDGEIEDYTINVIPPSTDTEVQFTATSVSVSEGVGTYNLDFEIINEDAVATSFDVVLTGDNTDIDGYTTQTVIFPGGTNANQTLTITVTDDSTVEPDETLSFTIQNVMGGSNAAVGSNNTFDLTITNNDLDPPIALPYSEDFSNCGTAEWTSFDESGDDSWQCTSGEYAMNGFPGDSNDVDWLISDFTIDFDVYSSPTIDVTTQERFGNTTNEAGEFELLYSTNYTGSGDPTTATWTALTFDPNNASSGSSLSPASITSVDASSITGVAFLAFKYDMTAGAGAEDWRVQNIDIFDDNACSITTSNIANIMCNNNGTSIDAADDITSFDLNPTGANLGATYSVDMDGFANISTSINGPFTNDIVSGISYGSATTFYLEPGSAGIGGDLDALVIDVDDTNCFDIVTITDPDSCSNPPSLIFEDFDDGNFTTNPIWTGSTSGFSIITDATVPNGLASTDGSYLASNSSQGDISLAVESTETTEWEFSLASPDFDPSTSNSFGVILMSSVAFSGSINTANFEGYYLRIGTNGSTDPIELWRKTGAGQSKVGDFPASPNFAVGALEDGLNIRVTRSVAGEFELFYSTGFDYSATPVASAGTLTNNVYTTSSYFGVFQEFATTSASRRLYFDNLDLASLPTNYIYGGAWFPSDPNGVSTSSDIITIESGDAIISTNTDASTVTVNPGASLTVDAAVTLTIADATDGLTLESTSSSYASLIRNGTISGTINYERYVNQVGSGSTIGNDLVSVPLTQFLLNFQSFLEFGNPSNRDVLVTNGANTVHAFGPYDNENQQFVNYPTYLPTAPPDPAAPQLISGKGYRAASTSGANITFTGSALSNEVSIAITTPNVLSSQWNLIGNPYPSYVDAAKFLAANSGPMEDAAEAIYAYNSGTTYSSNAATTGNYTIINAATISAFPGENFNIAPGQGFFVPADITPANFSGTVTFTTGPTAADDMRTTSGSDDYIAGRNSDLTYVLKLGLTTNTDVTTSFFFNENASRGLDAGYDAKAFGNTSIYSHLVEDNTGLPMALQSLSINDLSDVSIPLGVNANQGQQVTFSIALSTLPNTISVYLDDTVNNTSTLLNNSDYVLTPSVNLSGTGRFYLRIGDSSLSSTENTFDNLSIYTNKADKTIVISGQLAASTVAYLYDLQGRKVITTDLITSSSSQTIDVSDLSIGVYVIQLQNASQTKTQKVIIR